MYVALYHSCMTAVDTDSGPQGATLASVASLVGDASRAAMLAALLDGRALTAGELARVAWIAPQTASGHLAQLVDGGLLDRDVQGRHRYYRIANADVAHAIEALSAITPQPGPAPSPRPTPTAVQRARTCYDHLAGQLGVGLADTLVARGILSRSGREFAVTPAGAAWFSDFGVDVERVRRSKRKFATTCLDWTERRHHIGGALGAAIAVRVFELRWVARIEGSRALRVTVAGRAALERDLRLPLQVSVQGSRDRPRKPAA